MSQVGEGRKKTRSRKKMRRDPNIDGRNKKDKSGHEQGRIS